MKKIAFLLVIFLFFLTERCFGLNVSEEKSPPSIDYPLINNEALQGTVIYYPPDSSIATGIQIRITNLGKKSLDFFEASYYLVDMDDKIHNFELAQIFNVGSSMKLNESFICPRNTTMLMTSDTPPSGEYPKKVQGFYVELNDSQIICFGLDAAFWDKVQQFVSMQMTRDAQKTISGTNWLAIWSLSEIVSLFNEYTEKMGGAGCWCGVKSYWRFIITNGSDPWIRLKVQVVWTPSHLEMTSRGGEGVFNEKKFFQFTKLMPTRFDDYESCRRKIRQCLQLTYPNKTKDFYVKILNVIREKTGSEWL